MGITITLCQFPKLISTTEASIQKITTIINHKYNNTNNFSLKCRQDKALDRKYFFLKNNKEYSVMCELNRNKVYTTA